MSKLKINNQSYKLSTDNYHKTRHSKQQIVLANTFSENMNHFNGWTKRYGGKFKRTAAFTIDIYGNVYQHYPPEFYSNFFSIGGLDEHIIPVLIENEGWLEKDIHTGEYINYVGNIYNRKDEVVEKTWRDYDFWAPYTKEQLESAVNLSNYLCEVFGIVKKTVTHNTKFDGIYDFSGVVYKSNYNKHYSDLSPAWDFVEFKNELEKSKNMGHINEHDMTKNMLDRIRGMHDGSTLNESVGSNVESTTNEPQALDEHDRTKDMLYKLRNPSILNEAPITSGGLLSEGYDNNNDVVKVENDELGEEAAKLRDMVGGVDLKLYEVYPKDKNVVMVGVLDNGIEFKFSKKEQAPYINVDNMRLDAETVDVIKKLQGYYVNWTQYWAEKITEYTQSL